MIYDAEINDQDFEDDEYAANFLRNKLKVNLIDFAKSERDQQINEPDADLLTGVENLTKCLTSILENADIKPYLS